MDNSVRLEASEVADGRPFTDPDHTAEDLVAIHDMLSRLRRVLGETPALPEHPRPLVLNAPERDGRQHRIVLCNDRRLTAGKELSLVGFFAKKRPDVDPSPLTTMDDELILEFPHYPGVLSYSSLELVDTNWANMILLDPPEAREHWRTGDKHAYAARELAPRHYSVIRLHNGLVPGGVLSGRDPILVRTKYYDFQGPEPWRAERELRPDASRAL